MLVFGGFLIAQVDPSVLQGAGEIGKILLLVSAVAIGMRQVLGSTIQAQVESLQASGLVEAKFGGVAAMVVGVIYGIGLGLVAYFSTGVNALTLLVSGILGGLIAGGGAITVDQSIDGQMLRKLDQRRAADARHAETMLELEVRREAALVEQARHARGMDGAPEKINVFVADEAFMEASPAAAQQPALASEASTAPARRATIPAMKPRVAPDGAGPAA